MEARHARIGNLKRENQTDWLGAKPRNNRFSDDLHSRSTGNSTDVLPRFDKTTNRPERTFAIRSSNVKRPYG